MKSHVKQIASQASDLYLESSPDSRNKDQQTATGFKENTTTIYLNTTQDQKREGLSHQYPKKDNKVRPYCPHHNTKDHFHSVAYSSKPSPPTRRWSGSRSTNISDGVHMLIYKTLGLWGHPATPARNSIWLFYTMLQHNQSMLIVQVPSEKPYMDHRSCPY